MQKCKCCQQILSWYHKKFLLYIGYSILGPQLSCCVRCHLTLAFLISVPTSLCLLLSAFSYSGPPYLPNSRVRRSVGSQCQPPCPSSFSQLPSLHPSHFKILEIEDCLRIWERAYTTHAVKNWFAQCSNSVWENCTWNESVRRLIKFTSQPPVATSLQPCCHAAPRWHQNHVK